MSGDFALTLKESRPVCSCFDNKENVKKFFKNRRSFNPFLLRPILLLFLTFTILERTLHQQQLDGRCIYFARPHVLGVIASHLVTLLLITLITKSMSSLFSNSKQLKKLPSWLRLLSADSSISSLWCLKQSTIHNTWELGTIGSHLTLFPSMNFPCVCLPVCTKVNTIRWK